MGARRALLFLLMLILLAGSAVTTAAAPPAQTANTITFTSPPPGTVVGSPVVITGTTARLPLRGVLVYRITATNTGTELAFGQFNVPAQADGSGIINNSLTFTLPQGGGPIRIELFETNELGVVQSSASLDLQTANSPNEQSIVIETPSQGTTVGSPVTITGHTTRWPYQGRLGYTILGVGSVDLGTGTFAVQGEEGEPATFTTSIVFRPPAQGGPVRAVIYERDPETGAYIAYSALDMQVAPPPPPQAITITSPTNGAQVGSPVVVSGRTTVIPKRGFLTARIIANSTEIGAGIVPVSQLAGQAPSFSAPISFNAPSAGTPIQIQLIDVDENGAAVARASINASYASQIAPPTPVPTLPPQPTPQPNGQVISFDSPPPGTVIGSPVTIVGHTSIYPKSGLLFYSFTDNQGTNLGTGTFGVSPAGNGGSAWNVSLNFNHPPQGGNVRLTIYERDPVGNILGSGFLDMTTVGYQGGQTINIDSPPGEATVGSPVTIVGRTSNYPLGGVLNYRFTDANGNSLGNGTFPVSGAPGAPTSFTASLSFNVPQAGGFIRLEVFDRNPVGAEIGNKAITLRVDAAPSQQILTRRWRLTSIDGSGIRGGAVPTISFSDNGYARVAGGCNNPSVRYYVSGNNLSFDRIDRGVINCGGEVQDQERRYFNALDGAYQFQINGNNLTIFYNDGRRLEFVQG